ncbi:MAG: tetratricopeptide repeat protein [Candidatus Solibacter sp.]|jgi:TolB-like protein/Tfp pilus assembly protein PilF
MQWPWRKSEAALLPSPQAEAGPISPESARRELERILASPEFANAARLRELLSFLVEETLNGAEAIKEVTVAMRVFNRRASFDSSGDSVVRVGALHLRNRLRDYYAGSGRLDEVVIEVAKGSYLPVFRRVDRGIPSGSPGHAGLPRKAMAAGGILLAVLVATAWWLVPGTAHHPDPSIAVLPMANLGDPEMDSLCQAFTEDLTTELVRLPQLRVIARTSAGQFRSQNGDVREIGRRLGVASVLEGSVRKDGSAIRFTAQLIDTRSRYHVWSQVYEREAKDVQASEAEVTRLIAAAAAARLGITDVSAFTPAHVPSAEARDLFWRARYLRSQKLNGEAWVQAAGLLDQAVRSDPQYAEAWAALTSLSATLAFHGFGFEEYTARARDAAANGIELDPRSPDAHLALAEIAWLQDHDWPAAERSFRRVIDLNPSFATGHGIFAIALLSRGRFDEALAQLDTAVQLNPLPYVVSNDRAAVLYVARRYDESIARDRQVLAIDPRFWYAHITIADCLRAKGRYAEAIQELHLVPEEDRDSADAYLGNVLALAGQRQEAMALLRRLLPAGTGPDEGNSWVHASYIQVGLGDKAGALTSLENGYAHHETDVNYIGVEPILDPLRKEPRFQALLKKLGF